MKTSTMWAILAGIAVIILVSYNMENPNSDVGEPLVAKPGPSIKTTKSTIAEILSEEPKVKDHVLTEANVLYISVLDDGTRRDGLASYFCDRIRERHLNVSRVKIVEYGTMKHPDRDNAYGILLGEFWCR